MGHLSIHQLVCSRTAQRWRDIETISASELLLYSKRGFWQDKFTFWILVPYEVGTVDLFL